MAYHELPLPAHYSPDQAFQPRAVDYEAIAALAEEHARQFQIPLSAQDRTRICLIIIDGQGAFTDPTGPLFVGGRSGRGAQEDNDRLVQFIYRNLAHITQIALTLDTHLPIQIFHPIFWVDPQGRHPAPMTMITESDLRDRVWVVNPAVAAALGRDYSFLQQYAVHYVATLARNSKYALTVWPYHALLGGRDHALAPVIQEAVLFHTFARVAQPDFQMKGSNPLTENYSVFRPEVESGPEGSPIGAQRNSAFVTKLLQFDAVILAGQAKSHCVAWTIADLLAEIQAVDPLLARKLYLLEDCASPVVVPGVIDFTDEATAAYQRFADAGMHVVQSTAPMDTWARLTVG